MNIIDFADKYRLKVRRNPDDDNDLTINGRSGQIYTHSGSELGILFMPGHDKSGHGVGSWCPKKWGNIRRKAVAAGMTLRQNGDTEGSLSFDPANREQAKLAIKIAGVKVKRSASPAQLANLAKFRQIPSVERQLGL